MDLQGKETGVWSQSTSPVNSTINNKSDLLGSLSQELRASMNSIMGFVSLLKDHTLSETDRDSFIDRIITNGDHVMQTLEDALNFSKLEKGEINIEKIKFNISEMVFDVVRSMKSNANKKSIDLHVVFKEAIPETIISDPLKLRQIVVNLLGNAIEFAGGDGFVLISLSYKEISSMHSYFTVEIDDSAGGAVRDNELKSIQDLQKSNVMMRPGFALSKKFAEALGGLLSVRKSELGDGNSYTLSIPTGDLSGVAFLKKRKVPSVIQKLLSGLNTEKKLSGVRVLLAEDSEDSETLIKFLLGKEGAEITHVRDGLEAIEAVHNEEFDVILMDIQMPILDGLEATRQIRQLGFRKPIIALTGQALRDDAEKSLKAGCDAHISKPVRKEVLIDEIQKRVFN